MTEAELKALLKTLTSPQLLAMLQSAGAGTAPEFSDFERVKLLAKYSASSGEGRAIRDAYELIDQGVDPVDVAQRVIAAQAEYDITPETLDEITGAIGNYASSLAEFKSKNQPISNIQALKDLGMTELAPLLPYINRDVQPVSVKAEEGDKAFTKAGEQAKTKAEDLSKQLIALQRKQTKPSAGSQAKSFYTDPLRVISNINPVLSLVAIPFLMGRAKKKESKEQLDVIPGDKASSPYTIDEFKQQQELFKQKQEQERQQRIAAEGSRYQQTMNKAFNKAYLEELARLQQEAAGKPTMFDVKRTAMLRALNG